MAVKLSDSLARDLVDYLDTMTMLGDRKADALWHQLVSEILRGKKPFNLKDEIAAKLSILFPRNKV
jgi:hypothetical protein